jgi:hypothetical protein
LRLHGKVPVSPGIRKTMHLDGVAVILPDAANGQLQLYALDFPNSKGIPHQNTSKSLDGSLAGQVFRTGKPWVGNLEDLNESGFDNWLLSGEGVKTLCMLPLSHPYFDGSSFTNYRRDVGQLRMGRHPFAGNGSFAIARQCFKICKSRISSHAPRYNNRH